MDEHHIWFGCHLCHLLAQFVVLVECGSFARAEVFDAVVLVVVGCIAVGEVDDQLDVVKQHELLVLS